MDFGNAEINWVVFLFSIGYVFYAIFQFILRRRLLREQQEYDRLLRKKMAALQHDIQQRGTDLKESIDMINNEYSNIMKSMGQVNKAQVREMQDKLKQYADKIQSESDDSLSKPKKRQASAKKAPQKSRSSAGSSSGKSRSPAKSENKRQAAAPKRPAATPKKTAPPAPESIVRQLKKRKQSPSNE